MKDLLGKLSSYNIFNYLLTGTIFVILAAKLTSFSLIQENVILGFFLYYFVGLVISRIGSLIIEPFLKTTKFVRFSDYSDFVSASRQDDKIDLFSEVNNMYRTFCSLFLLLGLIKLYERLAVVFPSVWKWHTEIVVLVLLVLFLFSYRKQTAYITKRVQIVQRKGDSQG